MITSENPCFDLSSIEQLFHGSIESINGSLRPGGYDGVLWTAEHSTVAQCYIPATGGSTFVSVSRWQLDEGVRPCPSNPLYTVAKMIGPAAKDVKYDQFDSPTSWVQPKGYASYRQVLEHLEKVMGYRNRSEIAGDYVFEIRTDGWNKQTQEHLLVNADFKKDGILAIVEGFQGMRLLDISTGDSDLTDIQYHRVELFRRAEEQGYDGIVIDDFCQSKTWGNVAHRSIGFFAAAAARLQTTLIPAQRFDWPHGNGLVFEVKETPEYLAWLKARQASELVSEQIAHAKAAQAVKMG